MKRAVRTLIRIIAAALVVFGGLELGLEYARHRTAAISWGQIILGGFLIGAGMGLFAGGTKLAEMFTDDFDE